MRNAVLAMFLLLAATVALAQQPMTLAVDASDAPKGILHSRMTIPVSPGTVTLFYPKWIPGEHGPTGPLANLVNMQISAGGKRLEWRRDPLEMFSVLVDVPANTTSLDVSTDFILPGSGGFTAGRAATAMLGVISWNNAVVFPLAGPLGKSADEIMVAPSLRVPRGWKYATSLATEKVSGDTIEFKPVSLTILVDSPVQIGVHQSIIKLNDADGRAHEISLAADTSEALEVPEEFKFTDIGNSLIRQAALLFGGRHYTKYTWLLTLSDGVAHFGLEHHESSDNRLAADVLSNEKGHAGVASLLAHEYVHSWNGKYRRPANLLSPAYATPMQGELLWVYEGLTTYLGEVLATRSGGWTPEVFREYQALIATDLAAQTGRGWRPLGDTATSAQVLFNAPGSWWSLRRGVDFYDESVFVWLEADAIIRERSGGKRSLDDFTSRFFGGMSGPAVKPYTFDDLVTTMNAVEAYDWRAFFNKHLSTFDAPLEGIARAGWKLAYNDTPNKYAAYQEAGGEMNLRGSAGMRLGSSGAISDVVAGSPAATAGLTPGFTIIAVNGRKYSVAAMKSALKAKTPMELIAQNGDYFSVHRVEYMGGLRYPHLVRDEAKPDLLAAILKAR